MRLDPVFVYIVIVPLICGCNFSSDKQQADKYKSDSIQQIILNKKAKYLADSIAFSERKELEITAFGQLKFGMCRDTVSSLMKRMLVNGKNMVLGAYDYEFTPQFDQSGSLYKLVIQSSSASALYLESEIQPRVDNLTKIISSKYGNPVKSSVFPDDFALVEKPVYWTGRWVIDTKTIMIGVANVTVGSRYRAVCWIYNESINPKQQNKSENVLNESFKTAKDNF